MIEMKTFVGVLEEVNLTNHYTLEFAFVRRSEYGTKEFHFRIYGAEENYFFFTYGDTSGYGLTGKIAFQPIEFIAVGKLILAFQEKIKVLVEEHIGDIVNNLIDTLVQEKKTNTSEVKERKKQPQTIL